MAEFLVVWASLRAGLPVFFLHLILTTILWLVGLWLASLLSPRRSGHPMGKNPAWHLVPAMDALVFALPLAACLAGSITSFDILLWGSVVVLVQLAFGLLTRVVVKPVVAAEGGTSVAAVARLVMMRLGFALINAAAIAS